VDVGQHAARRDGDAAEELVELVVVADGQDQVTRRDALLFVVAARVARELEHLGRHVLYDGGQVDRTAGAVALGEAHVPEGAADAGHREGEAGLGRLGHRLLLGLAATTLDHGYCVFYARGGKKVGGRVESWSCRVLALGGRCVHGAG